MTLIQGRCECNSWLGKKTLRAGQGCADKYDAGQECGEQITQAGEECNTENTENHNRENTILLIQPEKTHEYKTNYKPSTQYETASSFNKTDSRHWKRKEL